MNVIKYMYNLNANTITERDFKRKMAVKLDNEQNGHIGKG